MSAAAGRLFELGRHERARSHQSASTPHDTGSGARDQFKPAWDAAIFGPSGLLPGQTHTPTRIGRDLHELVVQSDQQSPPGENEASHLDLPFSVYSMRGSDFHLRLRAKVQSVMSVCQ